jgi:ABC-type Fe3+/spermidine/putrescine transport system ATPase subunit
LRLEARAMSARPTPAEPAVAHPALRLRALEIVRGPLVLGPLDLDLAAGEIMVLAGPSGCGKTSVLDVIAGFAPAARGRVEIAGRVASDPAPLIAPHRRGCAYLLQGLGLWEQWSARRNVEEVRRDRAGARPADELLDEVQFTAGRDRAVRELSGGERQRVAIARVLATGTGLYLLDEPGTHLDAAATQEMYSRLRRWVTASGAAMVVAVHDPRDVAALEPARIVPLGARS